MDNVLLQFVHISDTHLLLPGQKLDLSDVPPVLETYAQQVLSLPYDSHAVAESLIREIAALPVKPDFVLHTGDVAAQVQSQDDYGYIIDVLSRIPYPVHYVPGNHDDPDGLRRATRGEDAPPYYSFEANGVVFACLDSASHPAIPHGGGVDAEQLGWLEGLCAADDERPLVVALHHHPLSIGVPWLDTLILHDGDALHRVLRKAGPRLRGVFHGHIHYAMDMVRDGILYSSAASAWCQFTGWPGHRAATLDTHIDPGFSLVTITAETTFVRRHRYSPSVKEA